MRRGDANGRGSRCAISLRGEICGEIEALGLLWIHKMVVHMVLCILTCKSRVFHPKNVSTSKINQEALNIKRQSLGPEARSSERSIIGLSPPR